jgi:nuclear transport factor 2 (NTF2) superfamily protein
VNTKPTDIKPPFDEEKSKLKVKAAENAWNTCNPELVAQAYTPDSNGEIVLSFSEVEKL